MRDGTQFARDPSIVGIGKTEFSKASGRSETQLAAEAIVAALGDAGLRADEVDGLVSFTVDVVEETELARAVGFGEIQFSSRVPYGGAGSIAVLLHAAMAVSTGVARTVVCYRALNARSGSRFGRASTESRGQTAHAGTTAAQWCMPFGVLTPASWMALNVVRYMQASGATSEDFGRAVVATRGYAAANPDAWYYQRPITLEDHQNSRWIVEPCMRLLDCCQETDGSVAIVVTAADRARDLPSVPVRILSAAMSAVPESEVASDHYRPDLSVFANPKALAPRLFESAGVPRSAIGAAMIYDVFSPLLLMQLEALGFCEPGEARHFIADGNLELDGLLPCNTNGGLIGEGYIHGLNLVSEAVRQLRGTARSQVEGVEHVLVSSARSGAILGSK